MKKISLNLSVIAFLIATLFTSCDKDVETSAVQVGIDNKTGMLKVFFYADLDKTQAGDELVPEGTLVILEIDNDEFNGTASGQWRETATINDSGFISMEIPTVDGGVTVSVQPLSFEYDQVPVFGSYEEATVPVLFELAAPATFTVLPEQTLIRDVSYPDPAPIGSFIPMVTLSGQLMANVDSVAGSDTLTQAVTLTLHTDDWVQEVTSNSNGEYTVEIPATKLADPLKVTALFQANRIIAGGGTELREFEKDAETIGTGAFSSSTENVDLDFGNGTLVP